MGAPLYHIFELHSDIIFLWPQANNLTGHVRFDEGEAMKVVSLLYLFFKEITKPCFLSPVMISRSPEPHRKSW